MDGWVAKLQDEKQISLNGFNMGPLRHSRSPEDRSSFVQMKIECTLNINAEAVNLKTMKSLIQTINLMMCKYKFKT